MESNSGSFSERCDVKKSALSVGRWVHMYDLNPIVYDGLYPLQNYFSHHEIFLVFVPINKHINRLKSMKKKNEYNLSKL